MLFSLGEQKTKNDWLYSKKFLSANQILKGSFPSIIFKIDL